MSIFNLLHFLPLCWLWELYNTLEEQGQRDTEAQHGWGVGPREAAHRGSNAIPTVGSWYPSRAYLLFSRHCAAPCVPPDTPAVFANSFQVTDASIPWSYQLPTLSA